MKIMDYDDIEVRVLESNETPLICKSCKLYFEVKDYEPNQIVTCYNCGAVMETRSFSGGSCWSVKITEIIGSVHDDGIWI